MRITRKDFLAVFGVLMAVLVTATVLTSENTEIQNTRIKSAPRFALEVKKTAQKIKVMVALKSIFDRISHR